MSATRSNHHKKRKSGAKRGIYCSKRKHHLARPPSHTRIGKERVTTIRVRGGNQKQRALSLNQGTFTLSSHQITLQSSIKEVKYHPTSTKFVRENVLTKGAVIEIDSNDFLNKHKVDNVINGDKLFVDNLNANHMYAVIRSRPGQTGEIVGDILQGEELEFYMARFKKSKAKANIQ